MRGMAIPKANRLLNCDVLATLWFGVLFSFPAAISIFSSNLLTLSRYFPLTDLFLILFLSHRTGDNNYCCHILTAQGQL